MNPSFKIKHYGATLLLIVIFFSVGVRYGEGKRPEIEKVQGLSGTETIAETKIDFEPFWKVWNKINEKYPNATEVSDQEKVYSAIKGLVESLDDPYSVYLNPEETKSFKEDISGNFEGVGMEVGIKDKILTVIAPLKNTPADRAGIKSGDKILKIGDKLTAGLTIEEAIKLIRGRKDTIVVLTISREGTKEPLEIKITRDTINVPTLETELRKDGVFVIRLYSFTSNATKLFRNALKEFTEIKTDKLLIDLRGNPGGYLNAAIEMASWFLDGSKIVVTEDYGIKRDAEIFRSRGYDIFNENLKLVILIDGGSASASEILAGALHDHDKAKLVGSQSFGKGSVQEVINITSTTMLKITVAKWLTPQGVSISEKGLTPDYEVEITDKDREAGKDPQLDKAIEILLNWKK